MSYNLYLDDFRIPSDSFEYIRNLIYINKEWKVVRSYDEFVKCIQENDIPDVISFDHDLADEHYGLDVENIEAYQYITERTGYDCAKWLINHCIDNKKELPKMILIHSMNHAGGQNIKSLFESYLKSLKL